MKKIIITALLLVTALSFVAAERSRFFENGKVIDSMYVDSPEGLRIRTSPTLSASKICSIPYMIQVKVVAVGREATIDGITDPWIEILIPRYLWSGSEPEYGWVFGGYLTTERDQSQLPLDLAVQVYNWPYFDFTYEGFGTHTFRISWSDPGYFFYYAGTWSISGNDVVFSGELDSEGSSYWYYESYMLKDPGFTFAVAKFSRSRYENPGKKDGFNDIDYLFPDYWKNGEIDLDKICIYYNQFSDCGDERDTYFNPLFVASERGYDKDDPVIHDLIVAGVDPRLSRFDKEYRAYWDPIMKEHQKRADAL